MNPIPADWALANTHLASEYVSQQFCSIVGAMPKVLPPPELSVVLLVACCNLARRLADAYLNPVTINFDMLILERPTVMLDRFGVIVLWYLPGAIDEAIKNDMLAATMMMSDHLGKSVSQTFAKKGKWCTYQSSFQTSEHGLTPGCINLSPGWFLQGHLAPKFHPEVSATLKQDGCHNPYNELTQGQRLGLKQG
ncbi:hypothetical protein EV424DRAFT_1341557 [Suillus variegatus]|nr:hypothetical protein EV424DRAFT_1341557 [Suillus variegatus]